MTSHQPYWQSLSTGQIYWTARHETDRSLHHCRLPLSLCGRGHRLQTGRAVYSHRQMSGLSGEEEKTGHLHQVRGSVSPAAGGTEVSDLQSSSEESLLFSTCGVRTVTVDDRLCTTPLYSVSWSTVWRVFFRSLEASRQKKESSHSWPSLGRKECTERFVSVGAVTTNTRHGGTAGATSYTNTGSSLPLTGRTGNSRDLIGPRQEQVWQLSHFFLLPRLPLWSIRFSSLWWYERLTLNIFHYSKPRNQTFVVRLGEHILEGVGAKDPDITGGLGWVGWWAGIILIIFRHGSWYSGLHHPSTVWGKAQMDISPIIS